MDFRYHPNHCYKKSLRGASRIPAGSIKPRGNNHPFIRLLSKQNKAFHRPHSIEKTTFQSVKTKMVEQSCVRGYLTISNCVFTKSERRDQHESNHLPTSYPPLVVRCLSRRYGRFFNEYGPCLAFQHPYESSGHNEQQKQLARVFSFTNHNMVGIIKSSNST